MTDRSLWSLDPTVLHLNHGSYGAVPVPVIAAQDELRRAMEANPMAFMDDVYQPALERARTALAEFVGADPAGLVFVRNATEGTNAVLQSLAPTFTEASNLVLTTHTYNALANTVDLVTALTGAQKRVVDVPFPIASPAEATDAVIGAVDDDSALVIVDHVTSPTGLVLDVASIVRACEPAVPVLVDGAHAPGMVPLDIGGLAATFYVGNCHKWLCAPKGAGFLWVADRLREMIRPPTVSHGMNDQYPHSSSRFHARFDWTGTDDRTAWLVVPTAIETIAEHFPEGWVGVMRENHDLAVSARVALNERLGLVEAAPTTMLGAMAALVPVTHDDPWRLKRVMRDKHGIEFALTPWGDGGVVIRVSAQRYNSIDEYERFAELLAVELS